MPVWLNALPDRLLLLESKRSNRALIVDSSDSKLAAAGGDPTGEIVFACLVDSILNGAGAQEASSAPSSLLSFEWRVI